MIKDVMKNKVEKGGTEVCKSNCFNLNRVTKNIHWEVNIWLKIKGGRTVPH